MYMSLGTTNISYKSFSGFVYLVLILARKVLIQLTMMQQYLLLPSSLPLKNHLISGRGLGAPFVSHISRYVLPEKQQIHIIITYFVFYEMIFFMKFLSVTHTVEMYIYFIKCIIHFFKLGYYLNINTVIKQQV